MLEVEKEENTNKMEQIKLSLCSAEATIILLREQAEYDKQHGDNEYKEYRLQYENGAQEFETKIWYSECIKYIDENEKSVLNRDLGALIKDCQLEKQRYGKMHKAYENLMIEYKNLDRQYDTLMLDYDNDKEYFYHEMKRMEQSKRKEEEEERRRHTRYKSRKGKRN